MTMEYSKGKYKIFIPTKGIGDKVQDALFTHDNCRWVSSGCVKIKLTDDSAILVDNGIMSIITYRGFGDIDFKTVHWLDVVNGKSYNVKKMDSYGIF